LQFCSTGFLTNPVEGCQENKQGYIWIDAVCIDQKSPAERNVQIAMMDEIYSGARRVVAWLGRCDEHTHPALKIIERLKSIPPEKRNVTFAEFGDPEYESVLGNPPISSQQWNDYAAFIQRAWFNRVWVIQEAFLAKRIDVLCGPHILSWEHDIWEVAKFLRETNLGNMLMIQANDTVNPDQNSTAYVNNSLNNQYQLGAMRAMAAQKPLSLERLLAYGRNCQATQAQDYAVGLLGIWKFSQGKKESPKELTPDYSRSKELDFVAQVFTQYSWATIQETGDLNILSLVDVDDMSTRKQECLPSWVPDYSVGFHVHPLAGVPRPDPEKQRWDASKDLPFEVPVPLQKESNKLSVKGILFDTVDEVAATYLEVMDQYQINNLLDFLLRFPVDNYPGGDTPVEAFWRTLIKDTFCESPASDDTRNLFQNLIAVHVACLEKASEELEGDLNTDELSSLVDKTRTTIGEISKKYKNNTAIPDMNAIEDIIERLGSKDSTLEKEKLERDYDDISESFRVAYSRRRLFRTNKNYLGIAAESLKRGDAVWVLAGSRVPLVLRPAENEAWKLVGEAYIHGLMNGEVKKEAGKELKRIDLV
jgi:hypothetical protein